MKHEMAKKEEMHVLHRQVEERLQVFAARHRDSSQAVVAQAIREAESRILARQETAARETVRTSLRDLQRQIRRTVPGLHGPISALG